MAKFKTKLSKSKSTSKKTVFWTTQIKFYLISSVVLTLTYFLFFSSSLHSHTSKYYIVQKEATTSVNIQKKLIENNVVKHPFLFKLIAHFFDNVSVPKGIYVVDRSWGNLRLAYQLTHQQPRAYTTLVIPKHKRRQKTITSIGSQLNIEEKNLLEALENESQLSQNGFDKENIYCVFYPMKYLVPKQCDASELVDVMMYHFYQYWTSAKIEAITNIDLDPIKASILSTIVYAETKNIEEMPVIAGVYINRLNNGMRLESDPTAVYASGNNDMARVYQKHTLVESPYNTYRNKGLPPGPIGAIDLIALEAVINYKQHQYLFFCAKDNFNGTHTYCQTYDEHLINAGKYRKALQKRKIK